MEDRELLEAAAKAAGYWCAEFNCPDRVPVNWSPLDDDGDALRLAVDLQMDVFVRGEWSEAVAPMGTPQQVWISATTNKRKATRRAVVLAAAAMANAQAA